MARKPATANAAAGFFFAAAVRISAGGMTPRQQRFVDEYLIDLNATQAARRAGYSAHYASDRGWKLLRTPEVAEAIANAQNARAVRTGVTADRVVKELAKVAFGDPRRLLTWGPDGVVIQDSAKLTEAEAALVSEVWETATASGKTRRIKLYCKLTALTTLGRHLGLFDSRFAEAGGSEHDHSDGTTIVDARDRLLRRIARLAARQTSEAADRDPDEGSG